MSTGHNPFPFEKLSIQTGSLVWLKEFEDSPIEGAAIEFDLPFVHLHRNEDEWPVIDRYMGSTVSFEAPLPFLATKDLIGRVFGPSSDTVEEYHGSVYLGDRHQPIDLNGVVLTGSEQALVASVDCTVKFSRVGLQDEDDVDYSDTDWSFSAPLVVQSKIHNYRIGRSPSMLRRAFEAASRIFRPKG